ncbi:MAG: serine/threonine-protein kinase [Limisphaerales bacterium]
MLLYELLTGTTPFDAKELMASGLDAMRKTIREKEPVRPSTRLTQMSTAPKSEIRNRKSEIAGDLDWIVMKCLEKDRTRRYETANGLAADLKRHLNNEPVVARPPSATYQLQKAWRRHRLLFATGTAVVAALVVGVVALAFALVQKTRGLEVSRQLDAARNSAATEAIRAEAVAAFVVDLLDQSVQTMNREGNSRGLRSLLEAADDLTSSRLSHAPPAELRVRATIWRFYARVLNEHRASRPAGRPHPGVADGGVRTGPQTPGTAPGSVARAIRAPGRLLAAAHRWFAALGRGHGLGKKGVEPVARRVPPAQPSSCKRCSPIAREIRPPPCALSRPGNPRAIPCPSAPPCFGMRRPARRRNSGERSCWRTCDARAKPSPLTRKANGG